MRTSSLVAAWLALLGLIAFMPPAALAANGSGSISGVVYFDANANGKPDAQERSVRNVQLDLAAPGYQESRKTTDNGTYEFTNLAAGRYTISIKLPTGYGLSDGYEGELFVNGQTPQKDINFGVARADQLAAMPPRPTRTPLPGASGSPSFSVPAQPAPPFGSTAPPAAAPTSGPSRLPPVAAAPRQTTPTAAPSSSGAAAPSASGSSGPSAPGRPSQGGPTGAVQDQATRMPEATALPTSEPTPRPTATIRPTPTRTPMPLDNQQAAAERAQAALASPSQPRTGSKRNGEDVLLDVPFRSALDGSHYADTNSGSAAIGMALDAYGFNAATPDLRSLANVLGRSYDWDQSPRLFYLVRVAEQSGLRGLGLYSGTRPAIWTIDDVRTRVRAGYPVLTMIRPPEASGPGELGRERYVLIIGVQNNTLIYHDPAFPDTGGAQRTMTAEGLTKAWGGSPESGQAAAFSIGTNELGLFAAPEDLVQAQQQVERPTVTPTAGVEPQASLDFATPAPRPVETTTQPTLPTEPTPSSGLPIHPLLIAFIVTAGVMFFKITVKLFSD